MKAAKWYVGMLAVVALLVGAGSSGLPQIDTQSPWARPGSTGDAIDFGGVPIGQTTTATYTYKVLETSETSATVTVGKPNTPFGNDAPTYPSTLAPGQSVTFNVTFAPPAANNYTGSFTITAEGGYPPQRTTTTVSLSGHGVTSSETPSTSHGTTTTAPSDGAIPSMSVPFVSVGTPSAEASAEPVAGTTDEDGEFSVSLPPAVTVVGRLAECDSGPLPDQAFTLARLSDGFRVAAPGYKETTAARFSKLSMMGMESYDLGEICLVPAEDAIPTGTGIPSVGEPGVSETGGAPPAFVATYTAPVAVISPPTSGESEEPLLEVGYREIHKLEAKLDALAGRISKIMDMLDALKMQLDRHLPRSEKEELSNIRLALSYLGTENRKLEEITDLYKQGKTDDARRLLEEVQQEFFYKVKMEILGTIDNRDEGISDATAGVNAALQEARWSDSDEDFLKHIQEAIEHKAELEGLLEAFRDKLEE